MNNILVINLTRYGDIVQSVPMLRGLKRRYPESRISLLANSSFSDIFPLLPCVDSFFELDFQTVARELFGTGGCIENAYGYLCGYFSDLRKEKFDKIINITPHYIGLYAALLSGCSKLFTAHVSDWTKYYISVTREWKTLQIHTSDLFSRMAGLPLSRISPMLTISGRAERYAEKILADEGMRKDELLVGLNPGASKGQKQWPLEHFAELGSCLARRPNLRIILFGSKDELKNIDALAGQLGPSVINTAGKTSLSELAALMSRTSLLITNDTGPMHIAAACGTRIISIHMGQEKCFSTGPYREGNIALQPNIACHPCENADRCTNRRCRTMIKPQLVFELASCILNGDSRFETVNLNRYRESTDVFISGFDRHNFFDLFPLEKAGLTFSALCSRILRIMWNLSLSGLSQQHCDISEHAQKLVATLEEHYSLLNASALSERLQNTVRYLDDIRTAASRGMMLSEKIEHTGVHPSRNIGSLQDLTRQIDQLDERIVSLGEATDTYAPLTKMFKCEKQELYGTRISELARQTGSVYRKLASRCSVLIDISTIISHTFKNNSIRRVS